MSFERTLALRLQLVSDFGTAAKDAAAQLSAVANSLKKIKDVGAVAVDTAGATTAVNNMATAVGNLEVKAQAARVASEAASGSFHAQASATAEVAKQTALAVRQTSDLAAQFNRVQDAANKAAAAASGFVNIASGLGAGVIPANQLAGSFLAVRDNAALARVEVTALRDEILSIGSAQRMALGGGYASGFGPIPVGGVSGSSGPAMYQGGRGGTLPPGGTSTGGGGSYPPAIPLGGGNYYIPPGGGGGGGGNPPPSPGGGGGKFFQNAGKTGSKMIGSGFGSLMAGGMVLAALNGVANSATDLQDLVLRTTSAMRTSPQFAAQFNNNVMKAAVDTGAPLRDAIAGGYTFVSSLPSLFNQNSKEGQRVANEMYKNILKLSVAGGSSAQPFDPTTAAFDVNTAFVQHFKLEDAKDPKKMLADYKQIMDAFMNVENTSSTTVPKIGESLKAMGPLAEQMGMTFGQSMAFISAMAEGGVRGAPAGYAAKRILSREAAPSDKLAGVQAAIAAKTGTNLSMWQGGKPQDFYKFIENVGNAEKQMSPENAAFVNQQMAGLYAISQFDQLVNFVQKHGGAKGMKEYGAAITKPGSLDHAYKTRTTGNVKIEKQKTDNTVQVAEMGALTAVKPEFIGLLHVITDLANGFNNLSPTVKRILIDFAAISGGSMVAIGGFNILIGGTLKTISSVGTLIGWLKKIPGGIAGIGKAFSALRLLFATNPIGLAILGIIAVSALLYTAWTRDWFGVREKTAAAGSWIREEYGRIAAGTKKLIDDAGKFFHKFGPTIKTAIEMVFPLLGMLDPEFRKKALDFIVAMQNGVVTGSGKILDFFKQLGTNAVNVVMGWGADLEKAGAAIVGNIGKGIKDNVNKLIGPLKGVIQFARDHLPGSEPKANSAFSDLARSGKAIVQNTADGVIANKGILVAAVDDLATASRGSLDDVIDGLRHKSKGKKGKKAKGPASDLMIDLRTETLAEFQKTASTIEAEMTRFGDVVKRKWIQIWKDGHQVGRMFIDPHAAHEAARSAPHDQSARIASDTLKTMKMAHASLDSQMKMLVAQYNKAIDGHAKAMVAGMIATLQTAMNKLAGAKHDQFFGKDGTKSNVTGGSLGAVNKELQRVQNSDDHFTQVEQHYNQLISDRVALRKNGELPTLRELISEEHLELNEKNSLVAIHKLEAQQRAELAMKIAKLTTEYNNLNDKDAKQHALKVALKPILDNYNLQLESIDTNLDKQAAAISKVNDQLQTNAKLQKDATSNMSALERALVNATENAGKTALNHLADTFDAGIDKMLENAFGKWKGKGMSGSLKSAIGDFFATFIAELLHGAINNLMKSAEQTLTDFFKRMVAKFSGGSGGGGIGPGNANLGPLSIFANAGGTLSFAGLSAGLMAATGIASLDQSMGGSKTGSMVGALTGGIAASAITASILGGGAIGGLAGLSGGAAALMATPAGWAVLLGAMALGSAAGGLFGDHTKPATSPDIYNTSVFGQAQANMVGAGQHGNGISYANGQGFTENSQLAAQLGGKGVIEFLGAWIAANPDKAAQVLGPQVMAMFQGAHGVTQLHNGNWSLDNGYTGNWSDINNAAMDAATKITQLGAASANSAEQMASDANRMAASFATMMWGAPNGFSIPDAFPTGGTGRISGLPGWRTGPVRGPIGDELASFVPGTKNVDPRGSGNTSVIVPPNVTIKLLEGATVSSAQLVDEIIAVMPQLKTAITNAVAEKTYRNSRLRGDSVSAI